MSNEEQRPKSEDIRGQKLPYPAKQSGMNRSRQRPLELQSGGKLRQGRLITASSCSGATWRCFALEERTWRSFTTEDGPDTTRRCEAKDALSLIKSTSRIGGVPRGVRQRWRVGRAEHPR